MLEMQQKQTNYGKGTFIKTNCPSINLITIYTSLLRVHTFFIFLLAFNTATRDIQNDLINFLCKFITVTVMVHSITTQLLIG